ncbi:MAG TPA: stage 0 sporulation family protein [Thermoclostridium caenicola]|uniref:Cell fate regulator YaaT, PSP1 superfamily (Controls sporulation, competence, biofilm development) n=1 Tax=Thermoclostridium caenicola TaxID=659425 RepID=A0A1M6HUX0_9FIRM|nr:stage 0 sporulation family protein [Thermoclostridium caenicola]SHJ25934.1 Cell fate regulator YaaT, PSP1 superfamily (controls sporulation, competence, biofilm development) [Thermoclostridium caenicola]HOK43794.1 stage 0 sporulation family protein [Thermoclostridium caenicola]HOL85085.1 stage 0 sporulation family protein [Thermoclostridium caenicola]HOP73138.1 stage 0 sporulation family protein [Thermoclostridium caenicola]HPO75738.1 stage 0 sporulation family protein [Thermoclostridium ca
MINVVGVRFRTAGKIYYFDPCDLDINTDDMVIVETARGIECGKVVIAKREVSEEEVVLPLKSVIRVATEEDLKHVEENKAKEVEAFRICLEKIRKHGLEMKLIDVEYTFDNNKILFYFTADGRVDFRELVKDLASVFRTRIELRQIGVRDEAKMMGALGPCGRTLCCCTHLCEFHPVSIKMAKEQSLSLNPSKISGTCGRLMCCLKYEQENYEYLLRKMPKVDAVVKTPHGPGTVVYVNLLKEKIKVKLDDEQGADIMEYHIDEVEIVRDAEKKNDQEDKILEELKELED